MVTAEPARPRGRRPAGEDARGAIVSAARAEFAARGYDGTTLRGIARAARVDPRLVHHYFDGKGDVFAAALDLPINPAELVARVLDGPPDQLGERLVRFFLNTWDPPDGREALTGLLRAAVSSPDAARLLREFVTQNVFARIAAAVALPDPLLRADLVAAQMIGVAVLRYILQLEPLASAPMDALVPLLAPTVQRYLTGDAAAG